MELAKGNQFHSLLDLKNVANMHAITSYNEFILMASEKCNSMCNEKTLNVLRIYLLLYSVVVRDVKFVQLEIIHVVVSNNWDICMCVLVCRHVYV